MGTTLFIVDPQHDFIDEPGAALPVPNAQIDMANLIDLITYHGDKINKIVIPLDQHPINHIAHAVMWVDRHGEHPKAFSRISHADVKVGLWRASLPENEAWQAAYVEAVEQAGEVLTIWPPHCLIGSHGATIYEPLWRALLEWWMAGRELLLLPKSGNWKTEQYSSFKAVVVIPDDPSTAFDEYMRDAVIDDQVLVAGEALGHCVAASVMDAINCTHTVNLAEHMVLLRDCTSHVTGFEERGEEFLTEFISLGGTVLNSTDLYDDPPEC